MWNCLGTGRTESRRWGVSSVSVQFQVKSVIRCIYRQTYTHCTHNPGALSRVARTAWSHLLYPARSYTRYTYRSAFLHIHKIRRESYLCTCTYRIYVHVMYARYVCVYTYALMHISCGIGTRAAFSEDTRGVIDAAGKRSAHRETHLNSALAGWGRRFRRTRF